MPFGKNRGAHADTPKRAVPPPTEPPRTLSAPPQPTQQPPQPEPPQHLSGPPAQYPAHGPGPASGPGAGPPGAAPGSSTPGAGPRTPRGRWDPIAVGRPVPVFDPRPPTGLSYRPDTVCDGWSTAALDLRLASVRGYQHRYDGRPREDDAAVACDPDTGTVVFAVADGVSAARQPHIGSQLACRSAVDEMLNQVRASWGFVDDWDRVLRTVAWQLIEQARRILRDPEAGPEATGELLATTLVAGTATPSDAGVMIHVVRVGDSGVWQVKHDRIRQVLGGKSTAQDELVSSAVDSLPRVPQVVRPMVFGLEPGTVVLIGTDGFGDPLGDGEGALGDLFVRELRAPVPPLGFAHLLDFSRETFDDDRTLIALWPRTTERPTQ